MELAYQAFANPNILKDWWGPAGFTNTIHEFDLQAGGNWILTMHGPEKGNYENAVVFTLVVPNKLVSWTRRTQPFFDMSIEFESIDDSNSIIAFRMVYPSKDVCDKMKPFVLPKNEENFDRLEAVLADCLLRNPG